MRLTEDQVRGILALYGEGWGCNTIAKHYGVTPKCINAIVLGQRWRNVERPWGDGEPPFNGRGPNPLNRSRVQKIKALRGEGKPYTEIAALLDISAAYARQLVQRHAPEVR